MATRMLRCAVCGERVRSPDAVYPVPHGGPCHRTCADRWWDAIADACDRRPR